MTELVAFLSTGKGTWGHVSRLLNGMDDKAWDKVFLLTNDFGAENFKADNENVQLIKLNTRASLQELSKEIHDVLKEHIKGMEIAVNFVSGDGREHMALISALMKLGLGFRLIALDKDSKVDEL